MLKQYNYPPAPQKYADTVIIYGFSILQAVSLEGQEAKVITEYILKSINSDPKL